MFEEDPDVLYISIHRYDHGVFYPHTTYAGPQSVGTGKGAGFSINVGWNKTRVNDTEYVEAIMASKSIFYRCWFLLFDTYIPTLLYTGTFLP